MRRGKKSSLRIAITYTSVILLAILAAALFFIIRGRMKDVTGSPVMVKAQAFPDGEWELTWDSFKDRNAYTVIVTDENGHTQLRTNTDTETCRFRPASDGMYNIRILSSSGLFGTKKTYHADIPLYDPDPRDLTVAYDTEKKAFTVTWSDIADEYIVYDLKDNAIVCASLAEPSFTKVFGTDTPLPDVGESRIYAATRVTHRGAYTVIGSPKELVIAERDAFYNTDLNLQCTEAGACASLKWDEVKGDTYKLFISSGETTVQMDEGSIHETEFVTPPLKSMSDYTVIVETYDASGNIMAKASLDFSTGVSPIHAAAWTNKSVPVYRDTDKQETLGESGAMQMYCVLDEDEEAGLFQIRFDKDSTGWIESDYCMINLPDYLGDLVSYDITNSYASMFTFHEYEIPRLTGQLVTGYETVRLHDGSFLVPLLYPTAKKLAAAAQTALDQGYRLRIYDTYRPLSATNAVYDIAATILYAPIPYRTYTGNIVDLPRVGEAGRYQVLMIDFVQNNGWELGSFLARGGSYHNTGTAIDLGIEDAETGEILSAQTMMHDLGIYSTTYSNNDNAKVLFGIMEGAGLKTIVSEWWHFQDNDAINRLRLSWADGGVSIRGWEYDGLGWRYRDASGRYLINTNVSEEDTVFFFDAEGYLEE